MRMFKKSKRSTNSENHFLILPSQQLLQKYDSNFRRFNLRGNSQTTLTRGGYGLSGYIDDVELVDVDCTRIKTVGNCSTQLSPLPEPTGSAAGALDYSGMKHFVNTSFILGGASTLVRCFVNSFLKDPLPCLGRTTVEFSENILQNIFTM